MSERVRCEFSLVRYVPDVVKGEFANIGVILRRAGPGQAATVRFTRDWTRVRCLDPHADIELLEAMETEILGRLEAGSREHGAVAGGDAYAGLKPILDTLDDTLSNSVQVTAMRGTLAENMVTEMEQLLRLYVEPLKGPAARRSASGRQAIAGQIRAVFEQAGVWRMMRKRIAAAPYTQAGDPLKIDCGYRPRGMVRMFHAVSLDSDVEGAKAIAYSAAALRAGVHRVEAADLQLTAIVEPLSMVDDQDHYGFGVGILEREAVRVLTTADLDRVAETARRELLV